MPDILRDLGRFHQSGKLRLLARLVLWRRELWVWLALVAVLAVILFATDWSAANKAGLVVLLGVILYWQCASFVVRYLSPLYFGRIASARLVKREYVFYLGTVTYLDMVLLPDGVPARVGIVGRQVGGTVGRVYVVLLHPHNDQVVLPLIDDDQAFTTAMLDLTDAGRRVELTGAVRALRIRAQDSHG
jgi:hypothetical protein